MRHISSHFLYYTLRLFTFPDYILSIYNLLSLKTKTNRQNNKLVSSLCYSKPFSDLIIITLKKLYIQEHTHTRVNLKYVLFPITLLFIDFLNGYTFRWIAIKQSCFLYIIIWTILLTVLQLTWFVKVQLRIGSVHLNVLCLYNFSFTIALL